MSQPELPIESLAAWNLLNDVSFVDVKIAKLEARGCGLVAGRKLSRAEEAFDQPTLLTVPRSLVLNAEAVEQHAKEDGSFRELFDAVGRHQVSWAYARGSDVDG